MKLKIFPWDFEENTPYWINPENGIQWWIDESLSKWCVRFYNDLPVLDAVVFLLGKKENDVIEPITRVLICKKTNKLLADHTSIEDMANKIDMLRIAESI